MKSKFYLILLSGALLISMNQGAYPKSKASTSRKVMAGAAAATVGVGAGVYVLGRSVGGAVIGAGKGAVQSVKGAHHTVTGVYKRVLGDQAGSAEEKGQAPSQRRNKNKRPSTQSQTRSQSSPTPQRRHSSPDLRPQNVKTQPANIRRTQSLPNLSAQQKIAALELKRNNAQKAVSHLQSQLKNNPSNKKIGQCLGERKKEVSSAQKQINALKK